MTRLSHVHTHTFFASPLWYMKKGNPMQPTFTSNEFCHLPTTGNLFSKAPSFPGCAQLPSADSKVVHRSLQEPSSSQKSTPLDISILSGLRSHTYLPCDVFRRLPALPYSLQQPESNSKHMIPYPRDKNKKKSLKKQCFFITLAPNLTWNITMVFIVFMYLTCCDYSYI